MKITLIPLIIIFIESLKLWNFLDRAETPKPTQLFGLQIVAGRLTKKPSNQIKPTGITIVNKDKFLLSLPKRK